jgi:multifunctional methyltransferase subunit TRM112
MKLVTANFVTCAVKSCKTSSESFPLHFQDAELEQQELEFRPTFIRNILPRIEWDALKVTATEVCPTVPSLDGFRSESASLSPQMEKNMSRTMACTNMNSLLL